MAENTVNSRADEDIERLARNLADDVSLLLDERGIDHDTDVQWNGEDGDDEGWYVVIAAGQWTFTYITAERRWQWQVSTDDGDEGPHGLSALAADSSPAEIAEYIAANAGDGS